LRDHDRVVRADQPKGEAMTEIDVHAVDEGRFRVEVEAGGARHSYDVGVPADLVARLGAEPAEVVRATLAFLLDREPPSSILASFDCSVVPSYFPDYESELPGYLTKG
jgi:hypothetical protein